MFESLSPLPVDPILGLMASFRQDPRAYKVDLGVGVYKTETGETPILACIAEAERRLLAEQTTKTYVGPAGNSAFNQAMLALLLGDQVCLKQLRVAAVQTPGGCGALRVAAELIKAARPEATIWVSSPTWNNHIPLLGNAGLAINTYPYLNAAGDSVDFAAMIKTLASVKAGDLVLLHGCCHNPSGADLTPEQWRQLADLALQNGFTPFVDMAYQGFGEGIEEDAYGLRYLTQTLPEVVLAASCSKNFGVYRERVGLVAVVSSSSDQVTTLLSHMQSIVRGIYSMPPDHGAALVAKVLQSPDLRAQWVEEVDVMRHRIQDLRRLFSAKMKALTNSSRFDFIDYQRGMFSFLGLSEAQVKSLQNDYGIYMLSNSRASIAGLNRQNLQYVCESIAEVVHIK